MSDLRYLSINQLHEITGKDRRTITKRLAELDAQPGPNNGKYYDSREALKLLYGSGAQSHEKQLMEEQLNYERARAEKIRLEVDKLKGSLVPIDDVASIVEKEYAYVRAQLLSIPSKMAKPLANINDPQVVKDNLDEAIAEVLGELTADQKYADGIFQPFQSAIGSSQEDVISSDEVESSSMGGSISPSVTGSVEHAGTVEN